MTSFILSRHREHVMLAFIGVTAVIAAGLTTLLILAGGASWRSDVDWIALAIFGSLLFLAETTPSFTMKFGDKGEISPGWTFAFALVLFGMSLPALAVLLVANVVAAAHERKPFRILLFNLSVLAASMSLGALVLREFGLRGSMMESDTLPLSWGLGIILGGCAILALNSTMIAAAIGIHTGSSLATTLRSGLGVTMTADGALLSLAPIFVIAVDFSLALVPLLVATSYVVIQSARKSLQRAHEASHDPLTDLLNRRAFNDRLGQALSVLENGRDAVVLVMDFDRFKEINDSLGHAVGDALLKSFAARLSRGVPTVASAARLGGDEFAVLIPGRFSPESVRDTVHGLRESLVRPYEIDGFPLTMSVSIGVATSPNDGTNVDDLLAAADLAMYRAKQFDSGVEYHVPAIEGVDDHGIPGRIGLLGELSSAIENGELVNHYQPQVHTGSGVIDTIEALVRWQHPKFGLVQPNDFVGIAEQTDLIDVLTEAVLRQAMIDTLSIGRPEISLAVNVSARSLQKRTFAAMVLDTADEIGFPVERLELEITERALTSNPAWLLLTIDRLRSAGVRIAIDDFGTGYSSFASLRQIPADRLKIDRSLIRGLATSPEDRLIARTIAGLGHSLGLSVVAEGVETNEIWAWMSDLGCDYAQGHAIARPMTIDLLRAAAAAPLLRSETAATA